MNGFCDWCEEPADRQRGKYRPMDICTTCDERLDAKQADEEERNMTRRERMGWMRARDAGVD